jgi:hypothetical protein
VILQSRLLAPLTQSQFDALNEIQTTKTLPLPAARPQPSLATLAEKVVFVRERIIKLKPKKRDGVIHSISAMFQFTGGIEESEILKVIAGLQKEGVLTIGSDGKVKYRES